MPAGLILDEYAYRPSPLTRTQAKPPAWGLAAVPNFDDWQLGDIVLVQGSGGTGVAIQLAQRATGATTSAAGWSHAALYAGNGELIEAAAGSGIRRNTVENYAMSRAMMVRRLVPIASTPANAGALALSFAEQRIGDSYAWSDLAKLVRKWRNPGQAAPQSPSSPGTSAYCSALVAQCYMKFPVSTPLETAPNCLPCLPSTLAVHPWLQAVMVEWCQPV